MFVLISEGPLPSARGIGWAMWCRSSRRDQESSLPKSDNCPAAVPLSMRAQRPMSRRFFIPPERLRGVIIAEAELGEKIMRALILRRVALIENGAGGPVLIGPALSPDMVRLQDFLARNGYPHQVLDPDEDSDAKALVERYAPESNRSAAHRMCRWNACSKIRAHRSSRVASAW